MEQILEHVVSSVEKARKGEFPWDLVGLYTLISFRVRPPEFEKYACILYESMDCPALNSDKS